MMNVIQKWFQNFGNMAPAVLHIPGTAGYTPFGAFFREKAFQEWTCNKIIYYI